MARHAGSLIPLDFQSRMAERTDIHFRCRSRSTTRRSRCSNLPCRKRSSAVMKNLARCGAWTINPEGSSGTPPVHPSRNSLRKSLVARIPIVAAPFSAGSHRQQIPPIASKPCHSFRCRADSADSSPRCVISIHSQKAKQRSSLSFVRCGTAPATFRRCQGFFRTPAVGTA